MNIFSKIFSRTEALKPPLPSTIRCNYTCEDIDLERNIKSYLNGTRTAKDCFQDFVELMAYMDCLHLKENEAIFPLLEDFLNSATWKTKWTSDCGDYDPHRPNSWLSCIYSIYDNILFDIKMAENFLNGWHREPTTEAIMQVIHNKSITPEIYENRHELVSKKETIKAIIDKGEFTPKEALILIKDNWDLLYHYKSSYEAIEYCIVCSENHTIPKYFDSAFRDLGYNLGALYKQVKNYK